MGRKGSGSDYILTVSQFERMLQTAALCEDRSRSVEAFFILVIGGRCGLRAGELAHLTDEWVDWEDDVIRIPTFHDCNCPMCVRYAERRADHEDEDRTAKEIVEDEYWAPKAEASARTVPLKTRRQREALRMYLDEAENLKLTYSTLYRRVKRIAELTDGVDAGRVFPHTLRATGASYWAWAGVSLVSLQRLFGWRHPATAQYYLYRSGKRIADDLDRALGRTPEDKLRTADRPTWREIRDGPDAELVSVAWTPEDNAPAHPKHQTEGDRLDEQHSADEQHSLGDFGSSPVGAHLAAGAAARLAVDGARASAARAAKERRAAARDPDFSPVRFTAATAVLTALLTALLVSTGAPDIGTAFAEMPKHHVAGAPIGIVWAAHKTDWGE